MQLGDVIILILERDIKEYGPTKTIMSSKVYSELKNKSVQQISKTSTKSRSTVSRNTGVSLHICAVRCV